MGLGSIVSKTGLAFYAEVALIIFFFVFLAITVHTMRKSKKKEYEDAGRIPLDDHVPVHGRTPPPERGGDSDEVSS